MQLCEIDTKSQTNYWLYSVFCEYSLWHTTNAICCFWQQQAVHRKAFTQLPPRKCNRLLYFALQKQSQNASYSVTSLNCTKKICNAHIIFFVLLQLPFQKNCTSQQSIFGAVILKKQIWANKKEKKTNTSLLLSWNRSKTGLFHHKIEIFVYKRKKCCLINCDSLARVNHLQTAVDMCQCVLI